LKDSSRDWFKTGVHFVFGAAIGVFIGIQWIAGESGLSDARSILGIVGCSLGIGLLAAWKLDYFWSRFGRSWWH
jgi:hypothetical protein